MNADLKQQVVDANRALVSAGLVTLTWGNASAIDRSTGRVAIKPSGVAYENLTADNLVVVDLAGNVVEGDLRPSSDTRTHLELYRAFTGIGAVVHTHSPCATAFAQAGVALPCLGTTHADHFHGPVPVARALTKDEVAGDYEHATGLRIVERFRELELDPLDMPAVLLKHHAPFTWGKTVRAALDNSIALEACAAMALKTWQLKPETGPIPGHILDKHHERKHGDAAYYGQDQ